MTALQRLGLWATLGAASLLGFTAVAATTDWTIDPAHSAIHFRVKHMMVSNVNGEITGMSGKFTIDDKNLEATKVDVTAEINTINTAEPKRDAHLKSADFFDAAKYPKLTFVSTKLEKDGDHWKMPGKLTMHGVTKDVTWNVSDFTDALKDPWGNLRRGMSATTKINRMDYGVKYNKALDRGGVVVGETVDVTVDLEIMTEAPKDAKKKS